MIPKEPLHLQIPPESAARRLDRALADILEGRESRSSIARLIRAGKVRVNGRVAKPSSEVVAGDAIEVEMVPAAPLELPAEDLAIRLAYEDAFLAVVDKPAGMSTHPAGGFRTGTLVNALLHRMRGLSNVGGAMRPGIVHRLDKGTSGLLVVAKDDETHRRLARRRPPARCTGSARGRRLGARAGALHDRRADRSSPARPQAHGGRGARQVRALTSSVRCGGGGRLRTSRSA
jgi:hypothetical protein